MDEPLTREQIETLGTYNAEVGRGIRHWPEWAERMAQLQERFDRQHQPGMYQDGVLVMDMVQLERFAKAAIEERYWPI
jgi:hypothetical protein